MQGSAMLILRATLSESGDAFVRWKQRVILDCEAMFPGMSKAFACQPSETSLLFVAVFPEATPPPSARLMLSPCTSHRATTLGARGPHLTRAAWA